MKRRPCHASLILLLALGATGLVVRPAAAERDVIRIDVVVDGFGPGRGFVSPRDICCDTLHDEIYVADAGAHRVFVFDGGGWPVYQFVHRVTVRGERREGEPSAVAVTPRGHIVVLDALSRRIHLLDYRGRPLVDVDPARAFPGLPAGARPLALAAGPDGSIHVAVAAGDSVVLLVLDEDGRPLRRVTLGEPGDLERVTGLDLWPGGGWVVTDLSADYAVQAFDGTGQRIMRFGKHDIGMENFSYAADVAVARDGSLWVVDMIRQVAVHFDPAGRYLTYLGGAGGGLGSMAYPCAVALGGGGRVLVLEKTGRRFQSFVVPEGGDPGV